jgi:hypothetical protein
MAPVRDHRRPIAALLLLLYLPACTSWQVAKTSPEQLFEDDPPEKVRVTHTDGSRVELMSPEVRADSLMGTVKGGDTVSIALSKVQKVEVRESDSLKGLALTVGVLGLLVASVWQSGRTMGWGGS